MIYVMSTLAYRLLGLPDYGRYRARRAMGFDALRGSGASVQDAVLLHRASSTGTGAGAGCCPSVSVSSGCLVGTSGLEMDGAMSLGLQDKSGDGHCRVSSDSLWWLAMEMLKVLIHTRFVSGKGLDKVENTCQVFQLKTRMSILRV